MASIASAHFADSASQTLAGLEELGRRRYQRAQTNQARRQNVLKVAIIGAGWAGLAAAMRLKQNGITPTVFEAAPIAGGRARGVDDTQLGVIDNGQHLLVGAYTETLALIRDLQPAQNETSLLTRLPLHLESADGRFRMRASPLLPSPLHTLFALLGCQGLSLADRWAALRMMLKLKRSNWQIPETTTVEQLLEQHRQSDTLRKWLWIPLCLATLNTATCEASAQLFLNVLRDTLDAPSRHADLMIPQQDLTSLWPEKAARRMEMRYRHIVRQVAVTDQDVRIDGEIFDACIMATPPYAVARTLQVGSQQDAHTALIETLQRFSYRSIATLTLELSAKWNLPQPLLLLEEDRARGHVGQWVFERTQAQGLTQLAVVISDAEDFLKHDRASFVSSIAQQIREQCAKRKTVSVESTMPDILNHRLIVEKRATFAATPRLARPGTSTPWPRLYFAGDWTDTGYPAVLEGAVRSGLQAADELLDKRTML